MLGGAGTLVEAALGQGASHVLQHLELFVRRPKRHLPGKCYELAYKTPRITEEWRQLVTGLVPVVRRARKGLSTANVGSFPAVSYRWGSGSPLKKKARARRLVQQCLGERRARGH